MGRRIHERRAHPRSRGEHHLLSVSRQQAPRLIPAHAGSTRRVSPTRKTSTAHPRSRGEHPPPVFSTGGGGGSSPLTRGALINIEHSIQRFRLIPAHAGSTLAFRHEPHPLKAHPRSRGEHMSLTPRRKTSRGSSPLTRGAHNEHSPIAIDGGLIPAHAGSTGSPNRKETECQAHPRSRGEHGVAGLSCSGATGSSPLTRGARRGSEGSRPQIRLIPAHTGSTSYLLTPWSQGQAHPRSRGEHLA